MMKSIKQKQIKFIASSYVSFKKVKKIYDYIQLEPSTTETHASMT